MIRSCLALALALPLVAPAWPALGAEPAAADEGPVSTSAPEPAKPSAAPASAPETIDLDRQIRDYLDDGLGPPPGPRRAHGEVSVAVGSGGYRSVQARSDIPVGDKGSVSVAIGESRGRGARFGLDPEFGPVVGAPAEACQRPPSWRTGLRPAGCDTLPPQ